MRFYLADDSEQSFSFFRDLIEKEPDWELVGSSTTFAEFICDIFKFEPDVILTSIAFLALLDQSHREQLIGTLPSSTVLAISDHESLDELRVALKLGAKDLLVASKDKNRIKEAIEEHVSQESHRLEYLLKQDRFLSPPEADFKTELPAERHSSHQIVAFCSGKGGVGKSFLCCHLAAILAKLSQAKIVLVDLNIQFADLTTLLNISSNRELPDLTHLIPIIDEIDASNLENILLTHSEGFKVLLSPGDFESVDQLKEEHLEKILDGLWQEFDMVILDTPTFPNHLTLKTVERASTAFLVVTPDIPATQNGLLLLRHFEQLGLAKSKFKLVLNRAHPKSQLRAEELEKVFSLPVAAEIYQDYGAASHFENKGKLLTNRLDLGIMEGLLSLAAQLYPFEVPENGRLARLWQKLTHFKETL